MSQLKKELNIEQKKLFSKWLIDAIEKNDVILFKEAVKIIGKEWHVFRIKGDDFESFLNILWTYREDIKTGTYRLWSSNFFWFDIKGNEKHAYSYESKICFLVKPETYKLIYDDNNKAQLKKIKELKEYTKDGITVDNWQEIVDAYYKKCVKSKPLKPKDFFKIDCDLWVEEI